MTSTLSSEKLEEELRDAQEQSRRLIREIGTVQKENFHLRRQIRQDREWLAEALRIIHEAGNQSVDAPMMRCNCGLEAVLQRAHKRAMDAEQTFGEKWDE
jgi:predicted  nucleic acid-binding Zn-ribbon protein